MTKFPLFFAGSFLLLLGIGACTDAGTEVPPPAPPGPFTPGPPSFANDIHPILLANCATSGCHSGTSRASGFDQSTYAGVRAGGANYGTSIVIPGDSSNSGIMKVLRGTGLVSRMPLSGTFASSGLPDTMIVKIGAWIVQNAPNN